MIYTSYFGALQKLPAMTFYSVAGKTPDWFLSGKYGDCRQYRDFAPKYSWWREWHERFAGNPDSAESKQWYSEKYAETVLNRLNIKKVLMDFKLDTSYRDICLLCYETPEKFCHRHLIAQWLNSNGIECAEFHI